MATAALQGRITDIFDTEVITEKFQKRCVWVEELGSKYPSHWEVEFHQQQTSDLDRFQVGQSVIITAEVRGRKGTARNGEERIYTHLKATHITRV